MDRSADNKQKALIHLAKAQLPIPEESYRMMLGHYTDADTGKPVLSSKNLTYDQAHDLIEHFKKLGFKIRAREKSICRYMCEPRRRPLPLPDNVLLMVSPQQLAKIDHLVEDIHWQHFDGFKRWLKKYYGLDKIKYSLEASRVMEGLKGLWKTQNRCACGLAGKK